MFHFSVACNGQLEPNLAKEWLLTNGLGGFASSTIVGCNTRRYHGLLVAATLPPVGRIVALNRIGELLYLDGRADQPLELSVNQFNDSFHPRGYQYLRKFELGTTARWEYEAEGVKIAKELRLIPGQNIVGIRYLVDSPRPLDLHLLPFVSLRDFHSLLKAGSVHFKIDSGDAQARISAGSNNVYLRAKGSKFIARPDWWYSHTYAVERERGQDCSEDLFVPGAFVCRFEKPGSITLWADLEPPQDFEFDEHPSGMAAATTATWAQKLSPPLTRLTRAANDFIVRRRLPDATIGTTVIAGYPWFADWGRDTMISLPGLFLATGRYKEAGEVLSVFANYVSEGMIPNRFDDYTNEPSYNTVDASLWFIHACHEYVKASDDRATFEKTLQPACRDIISGYSNGTRFHIRMDPRDGLILQGSASTQLTWMDAKFQGVAFTPRQGKAVEINALWYNALRLMGDDPLADKVQMNFRKQFWHNAFRGLFDVVDGERRDEQVRPNQIFAVSLPHSPLEANEQRAVVEVVRRELLTPMGLRTLARSDPQYHGRYSGPQSERDRAYHNGTVWAWLIGPFLEAYLRVNESSAEAVQQAREWLQPLLDHMNSAACIGQISEVFDGDPPHRPGGAFAQAWSIAEVLRLAKKLQM